MAGIPRFEAQVSRVSIPTMQNFQQEQNEQIYKAVAGVADTTAKIAENLYSAQKIHEATVEGGKATKETDLSQLPTPLTRAQEAYNNAAIASFYSDFSVDAERTINVSAFNNEDNPAQFLVETDAYINGVAQNIPEHLRKQVLRPIQMVRESKYDTLLKHKTAKDGKESTERFKFNGYRLKENANFIKSDNDLDLYLANGLTYAEQGISIGASVDDKGNSNFDIVIAYDVLKNQDGTEDYVTTSISFVSDILKMKMDPSEIDKIKVYDSKGHEIGDDSPLKEGQSITFKI